MAALATTADVEAVIRRPLTQDEMLGVERLLDFASAAIRTYTGQYFELVTDDEITISNPGVYLRLPQRPVTAIASVVDDGITIDEDLYSANLNSGVLVRRRFDEWSAWRVPSRWVGPVDVVYSHGYAILPDDVVGIAAEAAGRKFLNPGGVKQQSLGTWSETTATVVDGVQLTDAEKRTLDAYKSSRRPIPFSY